MEDWKTLKHYLVNTLKFFALPWTSRKSIFEILVKKFYPQGMEKLSLFEYFEELETEQAYDGYFYSVAQGITIVILGSLCGLKNVRQIWLWATNAKVREFLKERFQIERIPCYYWLLCLLKMIRPASLNKCFAAWVASMLPPSRQVTLAIDGKTIRSTGKMQSYDTALHIISAQIGELGMSYAQRSTEGKSNEIPAVRELLAELDIKGCMVVADALNCQKETAKSICKGKGDYLLCVKDNQAVLKREIEEYVQSEELRQKMDTICQIEKNRGRVEIRTGYVLSGINWLESGRGWTKLQCIGAIHREFETKQGRSSEWQYYISSRVLTAEGLLHHARQEWSVECMHWLLDVHFGEDYCRVANRTIQQNLNMARKFVLNILRRHKTQSSSNQPLSNIMLQCLLDNSYISEVLGKN